VSRGGGGGGVGKVHHLHSVPAKEDLYQLSLRGEDARKPKDCRHVVGSG